MIEESKIVCPSCGAPLPQSTQPEDTGLCAACAASGDTPNPEGFQDTIASDAFDEKRQVEQTMSIGSGGLGGSGAPGSVRAGSKRLANAPEKIGRFEVKSVLGSGGFGTVYKAHDTLLDREVALKVPRWDDGNKFDNLFLHEAKAAARLRHPNIVAVFECGFVGEQPYIASEYVDGTPLSEILSVGRVQLRQAVQIVQQVAEAIDYAHSEGIVHRDLKPANIMMGKGARPQVMDFGLARLGSDADASIMTEGSIVGTPTFMAPEQARGEKDKVGPKSDQYSVGVLLYLMLCGKTPYRGETWSIVSRVADPVVVPDAPRKIRGTIPRDLEACCLKAMEKDPNRRYDSLADLANDLNNWLEGRPLLARPIGIRERLLRWGAKNRLIASLLAVITGLIFAALIVGYVLAYKFSNLAEYATERANAEEVAKQEVQRVLIDTFTESGLDAGNSGRNQEAVLWFGTAAARASEHRNRQPMALRERMNRIRFQNWLVDTPVPVRMFRGLGHWHETLVVHPTGQYLMSEEHAPDGQQCRIWHLATGEIWKTPWDAAIFAAAWNAQGTSLALASGNEIRTFRFPSGEEVERWQHDTAVYYLKYSPDGNRIAFGGEQRAGVRNLNDEKAVKSIPLPAAVVSFSWNPSGSKLAIHTRDHLVRVFSGDPNVIDEKSLIDPVSSPFNSTPPRVDFVDEDLLVVPESEQAVRCWNLVTGEQIWEVPCESDASFDLAPDRQRLAISSRDELIQVEAKTGEQLGTTIKHSNSIYDVSYDSSGTRLLTGCGDQFARVFSAESGDLVHRMRHSDLVHRVAWFPDSQSCVTVHWKADLIRVWKLGETIDEGFTQQLPGGVMHVKWSDDGEVFLPSGMDLYRGAGPYQVLSTDDGEPIGAPVDYPGRVSDGCFVPGTKTVIFAGSAEADETEQDADRCKHQDFKRSGLIVAADFQTGKTVFPPIPTDTNVIAVEASPDGRVVAALCHDRQLLMLDPESGIVLHRHDTFPESEFFYGFVIYRRLAFSPQGDKLAVWGSRSRTLEIRDAVTGDLLMALSHPDQTNVDWLHNVVFSPDGKLIASCSADQTVQIWETETGQRRPIPLRHTGWVFAAAFSQDGKRVLTSCQDRQARLWDLDHPAKPMIVTPTQADEVYAVSFLPGDDTFLLGMRNGEISAWDARQGQMIAPSSHDPDEQPIYTISVSPDDSRVIIISRSPKVHGFRPSRWQGEVDSSFSSSELRHLGEMIASQELLDGVMAGLANDSVVDRWMELFQSHAENKLFRWPGTTAATEVHRPGFPSDQAPTK